MNQEKRPTDAAEYALGHSPSELQRLTMQSQFWGEATFEWLARAGIGPGMRVLELGSGGGDVSLLVASLVGESGSVLGIERVPAAVEAATRRAQATGVRNVSFQVSGIDEAELPGGFDAVIGRLVLMYLPDPAATLARITRGALKPGGIVAFMEMDMHVSRTVPAVPLVDESLGYLVETIRRVGSQTALGAKLGQLYRAAGLADPELLPRTRMQPPPAVEATSYLVATLRSLLPMAEKMGVTRAGHVDIDTLAERMQQALRDADATLIVPMMVGAWTRTPG
jgi:ubiquinone/menaquinone biosynthesis C-methylase UbiE